MEPFVVIGMMALLLVGMYFVLRHPHLGGVFTCNHCGQEIHFQSGPQTVQCAQCGELYKL